MVLVLGMGLLLTTFAFVAAANGIASLKDSGKHVVFVQNLDVAEAGIDQISARLQATNGAYVYCPTTEHQPDCDLPSPATYISGFPSKAEEQRWAAGKLQQLAADNPSLLVTSEGGQFLAIKPPGINTVYSMSWVPSYKAATRQRLLKSEYVFSTFRTGAALLADGDINCCPSYKVSLSAGLAGSATPVIIHTNGNLSDVPAASSTETVQATASGTCPVSGCGAAAKQPIPKIDPRAIYYSEARKYANNWYDLCVKDGRSDVRKPNTAPYAEPCSGDVIMSLGGGKTFDGWFFDGSAWRNGSTASRPGVYYVYRANVQADRATFPGPTTIITEATANRSKAVCPRPDGSQTYQQVTWVNGGFIPGLLVVSGSDWTETSQTEMRSGAVLAQGKVVQHTSSSPGLSGQIIAENLCGGVNDLQGSILAYNGGSDLPLGQLIRSTHELELN
jgi:hypothetical protein